MNTTIISNPSNNTIEPVLYLAFELSNKKWKLGFTIGLGQDPREKTIDAGNLEQLQKEIARAKERFHLPESCQVKSCYEAGRDGFWLHRSLIFMGIENVVIDSASIEVNRKAKRAKTDSMDVKKLLTMLIRYNLGENKVFSVVHVPTVEEEDKRQLHRELSSLKHERTQHINRIKGFFAGCGIQIKVGPDFLEQLKEVRLKDGSELPEGLLSRIKREFERLCLINDQIKAILKQRDDAIRSILNPELNQIRKLLGLKAIGPNSAWVFVMEFFSWRNFKNRRQVGALAGLTPTPFQSGDGYKEQGISKAGNRYIRAMMIEIAWLWLRLQPKSKLSLWFQQRFGQGNKRARKVGIVALARKLLIALWRYLETGVVPEGAELKA